MLASPGSSVLCFHELQSLLAVASLSCVVLKQVKIKGGVPVAASDLGWDLGFSGF